MKKLFIVLSLVCFIVTTGITQHRVTRGILSDNTDPATDADVIMTAAIVGHACERLSHDKKCVYYYEEKKDKNEHEEVKREINDALMEYFKTEKEKLKIDIMQTPRYDRSENMVRINGGTGNLDPESPQRYTSKMPKNIHDVNIYSWALNEGVEMRYSGKGAYTGFVQDRANLEYTDTLLFWTFRHKVPAYKYLRWIPKDSILGSGPYQRIWGMTSFYNEQNDLLRDTYKMRFEDENNLDASDIVGYTHGMIQAIYNIKACEIKNRSESTPCGDPYEIAVAGTTKLASCFACSIFMEANGYPASATHLGRGDSWLPMYPVSDNNPTADLDQAIIAGNMEWYDYCYKIMWSGLHAIETRIKDEKHQESWNALNIYMNNYNSGEVFANLILDALTVNDKDYQRVNRTLR